MDALAGFLDGPRARGAFLLRLLLDPPWAIRIEDEAPLTLVALVRGEAHVVRDDHDPVRLGPGDVAVLRGPGPYTLADRPTTAPRVVVHPGQICTTLQGDELRQAMALGIRTWGNAGGSTVMLTGTYETLGEVGRRLLDALPTQVVMEECAWDCPLVALLADEITRDGPGQEAVLDRLLDLLLIAVLRAWFAGSGVGGPAWYAAHRDPVVGRALQLLHNNPAHPWTVGLLSAEVGLSRAALARRFTELVGEPPMAFLTSWRLSLAADLLLEPGATVGQVAHQVGYGSPFALSAAFKRVRGISPQQHRLASVSAGPTAGSA